MLTNDFIIHLYETTTNKKYFLELHAYYTSGSIDDREFLTCAIGLNSAIHYEGMTIEEIGLTKKTRDVLRTAGVGRVSQLLELSDVDILRLRNMGMESFREIKDKTKELF